MHYSVATARTLPSTPIGHVVSGPFSRLESRSFNALSSNPFPPLEEFEHADFLEPELGLDDMLSDAMIALLNRADRVSIPDFVEVMTAAVGR